MEVLLGGRPVGDGHPAYVLAEIGINHNGDLAQAKRLIDVAALAGCEGVKFQKRTVDVVYTPEELAKPRESPFGTTNGDLKRALEFGQERIRADRRVLPRQADCLDCIAAGMRPPSISSTSSIPRSTRSRRRP